MSTLYRKLIYTTAFTISTKLIN